MTAPEICVISGGVGAARLLRGLAKVLPPERITAVVNTGDDMVLHGLAISPDLDTCTYTLAEAINPETGWGLVDETWNALAGLERYGGQTWFGLGDKDLATHLYRTQRLADGATLTETTAEIASTWGLELTLLPMSDDPVRTHVTTTDGVEFEFQRWFVERRHADSIDSVRFDGAEAASPAPGVLDAINDAAGVVIAPSNPFVSIAPTLAVPGVRDALTARREQTVAVSPIIGGAAVKGPAADLLRSLGHEVSSVGIARVLAPIAAHLVIDEVDADLAAAVAETGVTPHVAPTLMSQPGVDESLARLVTELATGGPS